MHRSIKARLIGLAAVLSVILGASGWYSYRLVEQQTGIGRDILQRQDSVRRHADALAAALHSLHSHVYRATEELSSPGYTAILGQASIVDHQARALLDEARRADPRLYREPLEQLARLIPRLKTSIVELVDLMTDTDKRYPAMPLMVKHLAPANDRFLGAVMAALEEGRLIALQRDDHGDVIELLHEIRHARTQQTLFFRMFVASRSGAFGEPERAMEAAEQSAKMYAAHTDRLLERLAGMERRGRLGLQQAASLETMREAQARYSRVMRVVMSIYRSDGWRSDLTLLRMSTGPLLDQLWQVADGFNKALDRQSADGLREAEHVSRALSWVIGLFGAGIAVVLGITFVTFEYGLRRPMVRLSSAMERAALGEPVDSLPPPKYEEARQLVTTFLYMQDQIQSRRRQLEESERRFRSLVDSASDALLVFDGGGRVVDANPQAERSLGYSRDELLALNIRDLEQECSRSGLDEVQRTVQQRGSTICEGVWQRKDGSRFPAEANIGPVEFRGERFLLALVRDISEREGLKRQLLQSEKLASIGQLAAGVAHEINNPVGYVSSNLGSLRGYTMELLDLLGQYERIEELLPPDDERLQVLRRFKGDLDVGFLRGDIPDLIDESREGIERVKRIVQDLKDFSRADRGEWETADLHHCLDSTLNIAHNEIKYKATVVREYGRLPPIECIPAQLNQVFMNLLVNAAQAIDKEGTITVRSVGCDRGVAVEIADTGSGIPPEVLPHLFEPFFTTKAVGKGTGLGLSVSYGIIERHHGRIEVESEPGCGTLFRIWLPVRQPEGGTAGALGAGSDGSRPLVTGE